MTNRVSAVFDSLEDWQDYQEKSYSPESFDANQKEWVEIVALQYLLFSDVLDTDKALTHQQQNYSRKRCGVFIVIA